MAAQLPDAHSRAKKLGVITDYFRFTIQTPPCYTISETVAEAIAQLPVNVSISDIPWLQQCYREAGIKYEEWFNGVPVEMSSVWTSFCDQEFIFFLVLDTIREKFTQRSGTGVISELLVPGSSSFKSLAYVYGAMEVLSQTTL